MNKLFIFLISLTSLFGAKQEVYAQVDSLSKGDLIRITATNYFLQPTIATFEKLHSDLLFFKMDKRTSSIPIKLLHRVELAKGKKRHTVTGMIVGSAIGAIVLGISMKIAEQNAKGFEGVGQPGFWGGFASGALIGGGVGALIGHKIQSNRWQEILIGAK